MATRNLPAPAASRKPVSLDLVATFPGLRVLAWADDTLYASRGYDLLRGEMTARTVEWKPAGSYRPAWWRNLSSALKPTSRLVRDGFHALSRLSSGHLIAAVPGAIISLHPGEKEFSVSHVIKRGTRPLHIMATPHDQLFWGEYFDNPGRDQVHIYTSTDCGATWHIAYTFPRGAIRHVHNIIHDPWGDCLWVLTGDNGTECRLLRASYDFKCVEVVLSGNQQARAVALVPTRNGVYFSSDTPSEANHVYFLDRDGALSTRSSLSSSSIHGCSVGDTIFFSTMVEPSSVNMDRSAAVYCSRDGLQWDRLLVWKKDRWPMGLFQYGNVILPDGRNTGGLLAATPIAVEKADCETSLWRVNA